MATLLPPNATELERLATEALAQLERVPVPLRQLWNPDTCPVELLPYLAWAFSVDRWSSAWPESAKRAAIRAAYFIHAHKGTIGALRRVVEPLGYLFEVQEWWQTFPEGQPGTFALSVVVQGTGISDETYLELERLIDDAKPVSRHITGITLKSEVRGRAFCCATTLDGNETTVYPYSIAERSSEGTLFFAAVLQDVASTSVYPEGYDHDQSRLLIAAQAMLHYANFTLPADMVL